MLCLWMEFDSEKVLRMGLGQRRRPGLFHAACSLFVLVGRRRRANRPLPIRTRRICQTACKPGSVPAPDEPATGDGHSSGTPVTGRLARPTRTAARKPARPRAHEGARRPAVPTWSCSRWGLPCRPRCRRRGALLPHPFTLAGGPAGPGRRFAFCGTFPGVAPAGRYPAPCFHGARTFLPRPATPRTTRRPKAAIRPSGRHRG